MTQFPSGLSNVDDIIPADVVRERNNNQRNKVPNSNGVRTSGNWGGLKKSKPNTLPVLNCLFAALNNGIDADREDDTPYMDIPATG